MRISDLRLVLTITMLCPLASLGGCGDDDSATDMAQAADMTVPVPVPRNFNQIAEQVLQPGCANSKSCHTQIGARTAGPAKVNLCSAPRVEIDSDGSEIELCPKTATPDDAYAALMNRKSRNAMAAGDQYDFLIVPCDPDTSFFVKKIELPPTANDSAVEYGKRMPNNADPLHPQVIKGIRDWISRGALRDEPADVTGTTCTPRDGGA